MYKQNRNRTAKSGERIDFRLYQLRALQVPKGWDRLFVSIISMESGKMIDKSNKALVRNGTCQWTENIAESVWFPQDDSSKDLEDCLFKLVVAMGSARSGILGEATINITSFANSSMPSTVSIPLKKCNHGTLLQIKIQCMTPLTNPRDNESKTNLSIGVSEPVSLEDINSDGLPGSKSSGGGGDSYTSKDLGSCSRPEELGSQETAFSSFESHCSSDSPEKYSPQRKNTSRVNGGNINGGKDSKYYYGEEDASQFKNLSGSLRIHGTSKDLLEAAENTIEALQSEAKMWERNSQKLMLDLDILRKEFSDQSKKQVSLEIELSEANADRDWLRKEVERMKLSFDMQKVDDHQGSRDDGVRPIQKELKEEIRFQQEINSNLALQLSRSQESNLELVLVLHEMEETLDKQKLELEGLKSELQKTSEKKEKVVREIEEEHGRKLLAQEEEIRNLRAKISELAEQKQMEEESLKRSIEADFVREIEFLKGKLQELKRDCNELTEENLDLLYKLKETSNDSAQGAAQSYELMSCGYSVKSGSSSDHEVQVVKESYESYDESIRELEGLKLDLESKNKELDGELIEERAERQKLEERIREREEEISDLKAMVSDLENERIRLEEELQTMQKESDVTFKCLSDLQNDSSVLSRSFDSHVSANKLLEMKSSDLESRKRELEGHLAELESENKDLMVCISGLESEVRLIQRERDGLAEETGYLRKLTEELKKRNLELNETFLRLESKLGEMKEGFTAKTEVLEENMSLIMEDISMKEDKLFLRLDEILEENRRQEDELSQAEQVFNQFYVDKSMEVENLQKEADKLRKKILEAQNERDRLVSQAADEISKITVDKAELERYVQEIQSVMAVKDDEFGAMRTESEKTIKGLTQDVATLKQERDKLSKLLENKRLGEEKLRTMINELELRITVSEYERQELMGKATDVKVHLRKIEQLKNEVGEAKLEKAKLEADLKSTLKKLEVLKEERNAGLERISTLETLAGELEDCKRINAALEEKLVRLGSELAADEAMHSEAMEVRIELTSVRKESRQFQQMMKTLKKERDEYLASYRVLEDELKAVKEEKKNQKYSSGMKNAPKAVNRISLMNDDSIYSKNESPRSVSKQRDARRMLFPKSSQVVEVTRDRPSFSNASYVTDESFLTDAAEAENSSKTTLERLIPDAVDSPATGRPTPGGEVVTKEKFERTKSSLELELIEIRERYSQMSLRYAEVEAQREELVMKLKAARSAKRWFS